MSPRSRSSTLDQGFDAPPAGGPLSLREAISRSFELFAAAFNRRFGDRAVDGYAEILAGYEPDDVLQAAKRIARTGESAPTPGTWMQVAKQIAWDAGRFRSTPWSAPPWANRIARDPPNQWGTDSRHGGYFWLPGEHRRGEAGEAWAYDEFGVARQTGILVRDPKGFLVFVPLGERPEDQPEWDREGPTLLEGIKAIVASVGTAEGARYHATNLPEGVRHVGHAVLESFQSIGQGVPR